MMVICYIPATTAYNIVCVSVTKHASATIKSTLEPIRTIFVWIFCMIVPNTEPFWFKVHVKFSILQLLGFIILVFGTLMYNEIIKIPFLHSK